MGEAMDFYRKLGLQFTMGTEADGHAEASGPGGLRIMLDTEEMIQVLLVMGSPVGKPPDGAGLPVRGPGRGRPAPLELTLWQVVAIPTWRLSMPPGVRGTRRSSTRQATR